MQDNPLVSVVIPTYNRARTIGATVEAVLKQTYSRIEIIVVDDGSTDETEAILRNFAGKIKYIRQANTGPAGARNRGIRESEGRIITFLDSDDLWLPQYVERHIDVLERAPRHVPCSIANGWLEFSDGRRVTSFENSQLDPAIPEGLCLNMPEILASRFVMFCQFVAIRREALEFAKGFDEDIKFMEDYSLPLRLSVLGPWAFISEPLVVWQQGAPTTISVSQRAQQRAAELRESLLTIRTRFLQTIEHHPHLAHVKKMQMRELKWDRLELRALRLRQNGRPKAGQFVFNCVRYRKSLFRHGITFPRMKVSKFISAVKVE